MTWDINTSVGEECVGIKIVPTEVLYRHDTPLLFKSKMGVLDALCYKLEEMGSYNLLLISPTTDQIVGALKQGLLSVRGALNAQSYWIAELDGYEAKRTWAVRKNELPEDFLPEKRAGLFDYFGEVPDIIEEENAFFSVKFSGPELTESGLSFKTFKSLVDQVYSTVHKLFRPSALSGTRTTQLFDFEIAQPRFASLAITVLQPIIDVEGIRRRTRSDNLDLNNQIRSELIAGRDNFFEKTADILDRSLEGVNFNEFLVENHSFVEAISNLIPNESAGYSRVEFNAYTRTGRKSVVIDQNAASRIRAAFEENTAQRMTVRGNITEINSDRKTFIIRTRGDRQITCAFPDDIYSWLSQRNAINIGKRIVLKGNFWRRPRRDYIWVDHYPNLGDAG
jgi:hypothetical protein